MIVGLHDAEKDYFRHGKIFPNLALMKISAWHKAQGDTVEWWVPVLRYDVYTAARCLISRRTILTFQMIRSGEVQDTVIYLWTRYYHRR